MGAIGLSVLLSLFIGFMAQASSPNYKGLFLSIFPVVIVDGALIAFACGSKEKAKILVVAIPALLGFASYLEMACRVWFGFRAI